MCTLPARVPSSALLTSPPGLLRCAALRCGCREKFITPEELAVMARGAGMRLVAAAGMELALPRGAWRLGPGLSVNYIAMLQQEAAAAAHDGVH